MTTRQTTQQKTILTLEIAIRNGARQTTRSYGPIRAIKTPEELEAFEREGLPVARPELQDLRRTRQSSPEIGVRPSQADKCALCGGIDDQMCDDGGWR